MSKINGEQDLDRCQVTHHHQLEYLKNRMPSQQEMCVCDLSDLLGISQSAVSHQLRLLRTSRLVKNRREGKSVFYSLDDDHVATILAQGMEHIRHQ